MRDDLRSIRAAIHRLRLDSAQTQHRLRLLRERYNALAVLVVIATAVALLCAATVLLVVLL